MGELRRRSSLEVEDCTCHLGGGRRLSLPVVQLLLQYSTVLYTLSKIVFPSWPRGRPPVDERGCVSTTLENSTVVSIDFRLGQTSLLCPLGWGRSAQK